MFTSLGVYRHNMVVTCLGFHLVTAPLFVPLKIRSLHQEREREREREGS